MKNLKCFLIIFMCSLLLMPMFMSGVVFGVYSGEESRKVVVEDVVEDVSGFTDVLLSHVYFTAIDYVRRQGIVNGYDDGTYKPSQEINRAEFTKIIIEARYSDSEIDTCISTKDFSDVKISDWYEKYVCVAVNNGIINGYDDATFRGGNEINFVEAAKIIVIGFDLDYEEGEQWYEGYIQVLQDNNYIPSAITTLNQQVTRGEMAEMIWRISENVTTKASPILISEKIEPIKPHPAWYVGTKWGYDTLSPEYDFIFGDKDGVDAYVQAYTKAGSDLNTAVWFDHPFVDSENLTINGLETLKRHYRAPRGTVVNGRTTGENENIYVYTYKIDGKVVVLQYFNAYGTENKNVDIFFDMAESLYWD